MSVYEKAKEAFDNRKLNVERENAKRKEKVYRQIPEIRIIDQKIKNIGFDAVNKVFDNIDTSKDEEKINILMKRKEEYLVSNGYPKDYLKKRYYHDLCKDTGYVDGKICSCLNQLIIEERYNMSNLRNVLRRENFKTFNKNLYSKNRYKNYDESPYDNISDILIEAKNYIYNFSKTSNGNIYIFGDVGRGKTFLINSIAKELMDSNYSVIYWTAPKLFSFMQDYYYSFADGKEKLKEKYDSLFKTDLLIVDDLGAENIRGDLDISNFFEIINDRMINGKAMIFSSNHNLDEFREIYGDRILSRLLGTFKLWEIYGEDLRLK